MDKSSPITIRQAAPKDAEAIATCLRLAFEPYRTAYTPGAFADTVPTPGQIAIRLQSMKIFAAGRDVNEVLGTIACGANGTEGHLRGMAVVPEFHGHAIAEQLLVTAESALRSQGCTRVTLDTTEPLQRAIRFYQRRGYRRSGRVTDFYGMPLIEFAKSL